jgi:acetyltransferase-like isoleucine patch superfamily enzyme
VFGPGVEVADGAEIKAFCHLGGARSPPAPPSGPLRGRPGTVVGERARIGNFVEAKNATLGPGAKANHLTYLGDAVIGAGANVGAGTITANYDGFNKHKTEIGTEASIGSNSVLVAPVKVGRGAIVGAGSVITQSVSADALALGRGRQTEKPGWAAKFRESKGTLGKGTVVRHGDKAFRVTITRPDGTVLPTGPSTVRIAPAKRPPQPAPAAISAATAEPSPQTPSRASNGATSKARRPAPKAALAAKPKKPVGSKKSAPAPGKGKR